MKAAEKKASLLSFSYEGTDRKGQAVKGELNARSMTLAKLMLKKQGVVLSRIREKREAKFFKKPKKRISSLDIAIFTRQLATMLKAGVPLVQSFEIVADGLENLNMRSVVREIKNHVENGNHFANALMQHPQHFDHLFCSLVQSGEQSGALEIMLDRVAIYKEKSELLRRKIKKAMFYPVAVLCIGLGVAIILLIYVVPAFQELFGSFGAELPAYTQMVIDMSIWMQSNWYKLLLFLFSIPVVFQQLKKRSPTFAYRLDRFKLKIPIFGAVIYKSIVARYSRTLSTTFAAGVPLVDALEFAAASTNNAIYQQAVMKIREDISAGQQLHYAMRASDLFPSMANQMVAIGEESGALDHMLDKVAIYFESEVDNSVDGLTSLMQPLIMVVLGVLVGGLVVAMYLPIFQMGNVV